MEQDDDKRRDRTAKLFLHRRALLRGAAFAGVAASASVSLKPAQAEIREEGDTQCQAVVTEVAPSYNTEELFGDFMSLSKLLTGIDALDNRIGAQYLQRYARNSELSSLLPSLVQAYRGIARLPEANRVAAVAQDIMKDFAHLGPAAEQLIYLWYVSAFFLPLSHSAASRNWLYGTVEQYHYALLWSNIDAHAPMTRGGEVGYWATEPKSAGRTVARINTPYQPSAY